MNYSISFYDYPENSPLAEFHNQAISIFRQPPEFITGCDGYISRGSFVSKIIWETQSALFMLDNNYYVRIKEPSGKIILDERITETYSKICQENFYAKFDTISES